MPCQPMTNKCKGVPQCGHEKNFLVCFSNSCSELSGLITITLSEVDLPAVSSFMHLSFLGMGRLFDINLAFLIASSQLNSIEVR